MATYSNLVPSWVLDLYGDERFLTPYSEPYMLAKGDSVNLVFDLPDNARKKITGVKLNFDAQLGQASAYGSAYVYAKLTNYSGSETSAEKPAYITSVGQMESTSIYISGSLDFTAFETDSFYITLRVADNATSSHVYFKNVKVDVTYTEPYVPQPSVTATSPSAQVFSDWESFTYQWSVSNGTQTQAVVQESTDNSNWINVGTVSGSGTSLSGTARYTASSGSSQSYSWRVVATFSDGTTKTSGALSYSVLAPPPEPDYPPSVSNISTTPVQPSGLPATFSSVYIANVSKCKVQAFVSAGTYAIREVYFSYPGVEKVSMTYDSTAGKYVGTTPLALSATTQTITITVTAVDTSGYYTSETVNVTVTPYADPTLTVNTLYRCNAQGAEDNTGQYYKIKVTASCSSVDGKNYITSLKAGVKNGTQHTLSSGSTYTFGPELPNEDLVYVIHISVTDYVGHETWIERSLAGRLRDVVFKRDVQRKTAHVGVGMTPDGNARTTVQLPPNGTIIIGGQDLIAWLQSKLGEDFPGWDQS